VLVDERCSACGAEAAIVRGDWKFRESGLPGVTLRDIELIRCGQCGNIDPILFRLESVLRSIALAVARKPYPLEGREIAVLRKYAERTPAEFAALLGIQPETLEQWERGEGLPATEVDRLIRLVGLSLGEGLAHYLPEVVQSFPQIAADRRPLEIEIDPQTMQYRYAA